MNEVLGLFSMGCELVDLKQEKEALRCFLAIRMPSSSTTLSAGQVEIVDMYIAELYLALAMEGQHREAKTYRLPDAARVLQRVPHQQRGSTSLPFPRHEWGVRRLRCEWMLKILADPFAHRAHVELLCQGIQMCEQGYDLSTWLAWYRSTLRHQLKQIHMLCCLSSSSPPSSVPSLFRECAVLAYDTLAACTSSDSFKLWLLEVLCHSLLENPTISAGEAAKLFAFCDGFSTQQPRPDLRVYFLVLHILLLFRTGEVMRAGPLADELLALSRHDATSHSLPPSWRHLPALLHLQVNAYYNPTAATAVSSALLSSLQNEPRDAPPFLWFDAHLTICHLLEAQGRYGELGHLAMELLHAVELPAVVRCARSASMRTAVHILLAKYAHALNCMDDAINHVNAAFALILAGTPQWPQLSDDNLAHMMGLLDVSTAISCFPLPKAEAEAVVHPYFPDENLLEFAAGVLRDTNLRALIYNGSSKEVRAQYDLYLCKWLWGTQCLGQVGTYPDMDTLRSYMLSVLQDCLELATSSINCSNLSAEIMVLFGPKLVEYGRLQDGDKTLTNALKIAMHTKNLKLQIQIMIEVHALCGRKDQLKSQSVVAEKFTKKLESMARKVDRALENHAVHARLLAWKVQEST